MLWTIEQMDCYPEVQGETDVVFKVHWTLTDTDGQYSGRIYNMTALQLDSSQPFTPYNQLTEEQVVGWVKATLGPDEVFRCEAAVQQQIENQKNPPVVTPALPWSNS